MPAPAAQPLLACRTAVARVAHSDPEGWLYVAFSPLLVNLGSAVAHDVRLDLHPISYTALLAEGCRIWPGTPMEIEPQRQRGDATLIALERELAGGLHVQALAAGDLPASSFVVGFPEERLEQLPPGWLPIFETSETTVDLERPGHWECALPSDLVYGICAYSFGADKPEGTHDHYLALPFDRVYVPEGWTPPPALVDTDGN